ncbi:hypothetical protein KY316_04040, partial [Candidatus Woesearchaeota archaeon]|nr:hypothetical protein [Candidatus Woesearchaeota archaeon]
MEKDMKEIIEKGGLYCRLIVELVGGPKEHIDKTIKEVVEKAKQFPDSTVEKSKIFETEETNNGLFSTFTELEMVFKKLDTLMDFCYNFYPSSVEIIEPEKIVMTSQTMSAWLNDLQHKIHAIDQVAKNHNIYKTTMNKQLNTLIRTNILTHLKEKELDEQEIQNYVGLNMKSLK